MANYLVKALSQHNFQRGIFLLLIFLCHIKEALSCFLWYLFDMAQNQNKQNYEKGIFLWLILSCQVKREAKTLKLFYSKWRLHACCTFENSLMHFPFRSTSWDNFVSAKVSPKIEFHRKKLQRSDRNRPKN